MEKFSKVLNVGCDHSFEKLIIMLIGIFVFTGVLGIAIAIGISQIK